MTDYLKVTGNDSLVRDPSSGAILNCNEEEYNNYKKKITASKEMKRKLQEQETEIANLKNDITEIKNMLYLLLGAK